jgi:hypothetical protein
MRQSKKQYVSPFYVAIVYAGLGEKDQALDWLEKAYGDHSNAIVFLKVDPQLDTLRDSPRFHELQRKLRLPDCSNPRLIARSNPLGVAEWGLVRMAYSRRLTRVAIAVPNSSLEALPPISGVRTFA